MGEDDVRSLSEEQMAELCEKAEEATRKYVTSRVPKRAIADLSISVGLKESKTVDVEVEVNLALSPLFKNIDEKELANEAVKAAFEAAEKYLRQVRCPSKT